MYSGMAATLAAQATKISAVTDYGAAERVLNGDIQNVRHVSYLNVAALDGSLGMARNHARVNIAYNRPTTAQNSQPVTMYTMEPQLPKSVMQNLSRFIDNPAVVVS